MTASIWTPGTPKVIVQSNLFPAVTDAAYGAATTNTAAQNSVAFALAQVANAFTYVPYGTFLVDPGLNYWQFYGPGTVLETGNPPTSQGREWDLSNTPQTSFGVIKKYKDYTWGNYESACGMTIGIGAAHVPADQLRTNTQVIGVEGTNVRATVERPSVGFNLSNYSRKQDQLTVTTYTANTVTDAGVAALIAAGKLKRGMFIDITQAADRQSSAFTGTIQSWSGNTITVDAWWSGVGAAGTPLANAVATVNPVNKLWGQNLNIAVNEDHVNAAGYELGMLAGNANRAGGIIAFDAVNLGTPGGVATQYANFAHFLSRGLTTYGFAASAFWSVGSVTGPAVGFVSEYSSIDSYVARNPASGYAFSVVTGAAAGSRGLYDTGGTRKWSIDGATGALLNDFRNVKLDTDLTAVTAGKVLTASACVVINTTNLNALLLPTAVGATGRVYTIMAAEAFNIAPTGGEFIDGLTTAIGIYKFGTIKLISDGTNWSVMQWPTNRSVNIFSTPGGAGAYVVTRDNEWISHQGTGTVTLPAPSTNLARKISIRAIGGNATIATAAGQIDDGAGGFAATFTLLQYKTLTVVSDGTNWLHMFAVA